MKYLLSIGLMLCISSCGDFEPDKQIVATQNTLNTTDNEFDSEDVIRGTNEPTVFDLSEGQKLAIGALLLEDKNFCTGALIKDDVVLSAAHCVVYSEKEQFFGIGNDMAAPLAKFKITHIERHPNGLKDGETIRASNDMALFYLEEPVSNRFPEVKPLRFYSGSIDHLLGQHVQNVGYGKTSIFFSSNTKRYWASVKISNITEVDFTVEGKLFQTRLCNGDSGGPSLALIDGHVQIIGTLSNGLIFCLGSSNYALSSDNYSWVLRRVGGFDYNTDFSAEDETCEYTYTTSEGSTETITIEPFGTCIGNVLTWCDNSEVLMNDCRSFASICGNVYSNDTMGCKLISEQNIEEDPCLGVDITGMCADNTLFWCESDQLYYMDCSENEYECGLLPDMNAYDCLK